MIYMVSLMVSFLIVLILVPILRRLALQIGFVDQPAARKIHQVPIPLLGGVALYMGCCTAMLIFEGLSNLTVALLIGGGLLVATGLVDDAFKTKGKDFAVWPRIIIYAIASAVPVFFGIEIMGITNLKSGGMILFPAWFAWTTAILWVFALTNMINFIDGVDGLASGIVTLSSLTLFVVAIFTGLEGPAMMASILVGACIAFLAYNFYPAKIFMGDAGATFLGYGLAIIAMDGALKIATIVSIVVPILALGVPILDTTIVFTRRLLHQKGFHRADQLHTHHSLLKRGFTQTQTVSLLYCLAIVFSLMSIVVLIAFS